MRLFFPLLFIAVIAAAQNDAPRGDCAVAWQHISTGVDYRAITCLGDSNDLDVHVVRIDPQFFVFDTAYVTGGSTAAQEAGKRNAKLVINANFFERDRTPIGLLVRSGDELQGRHRSTWQSIFFVDAGGDAHIVRLSDWPKFRSSAHMAVQAGPRIVVQGRINKVNKSYSAARAGVCLQKDGDLLFFATPQDRKFDMWEIGHIAKRSERSGGLGCYDSMLFDGGHSTQIYVAGDTQTIRVDGDQVPVFVFATRK